MSIHKRGIRRLDLVDHSAVPAVLALRVPYVDPHEEERQEQTEMQVWESEGGTPVASGLAPQSR